MAIAPGFEKLFVAAVAAVEGSASAARVTPLSNAIRIKFLITTPCLGRFRFEWQLIHGRSRIAK